MCTVCNVIITVRVPTARVHHHTIMIISLVPGPELMLLLPVVMLEVEVTIRLYLIVLDNCEAQGKGRAKGRPRKVTKRSFMDGGWWISFP